MKMPQSDASQQTVLSAALPHRTVLGSITIDAAAQSTHTDLKIFKSAQTTFHAHSKNKQICHCCCYSAPYFLDCINFLWDNSSMFPSPRGQDGSARPLCTTRRTVAAAHAPSSATPRLSLTYMRALWVNCAHTSRCFSVRAADDCCLSSAGNVF